MVSIALFFSECLVRMERSFLPGVHRVGVETNSVSTENVLPDAAVVEGLRCAQNMGVKSILVKNVLEVMVYVLIAIINLIVNNVWAVVTVFINEQNVIVMNAEV